MSNLFNIGASTSSEASQVPLKVDNHVKSPKASFPLDIQAGSYVKINPENLVELKKGEKVESLSGKKKKICKVLKFPSEWTFNDAINEISSLNPFNYPNLFVFIIEAKHETESNHEQEINQKSLSEAIQHVKKLFEEKLTKLLKSRQILIQLTSGSENELKIFYNQTDSMEKLHEVAWDASKAESKDEFPAFLRNHLRLQYENSADEFENAIFDLLENPEELSLRFLTIFDLSFDFSFRVASYCAANLSKSHFLAAMGLRNDRDCLTKAQAKMISSTVESQKYKSILEAAIAGENSEIIKYLIKFCGYLIERLPKGHQIEVTNQLVERNKFDTLCDLLTNCDFLFPTGVNLTDIDHPRFKSIVAERQELHEAIKNENYKYKINDFREENENLDIAFNINNESALYTAAKNDKVDAFRYLKAKGFKGTEADLDDLRFNLMLLNVDSNAFNPEEVVDLLASCSRVYGNKTDYSVHLGKIRKWLAAIYRTEFGGHLLSAAAQCGILRIVFDFNRSDVEGVDLDSKDADGIMYHEADLVIIAAKHSSSEKEQRIKGVLAHELTHFVMRKLFDNKEQPYINESDARFEKYRKVVEKYDYLKNEGMDDLCEGIISSIYQDYNEEDFDAELIVRAFQIQARYDDNPRKVAKLEVAYEDLFGFVRDELLDVMKTFNMKEMEVVRTFNKYSGLLSTIQKFNFIFPISEFLSSILNKRLTIINANVPKLFLTKTYSELYRVHGNLVGSKNIFLTQDKLLDEGYLKEFQTILEKVKGLNFFLDFSLNENFKVLKTLSVPLDGNFVFIVSDEKQSKKLKKVLKSMGLRPRKGTINYEWTGLTKDIQKFFLDYDLNFQNHLKVSLTTLFGISRDLIQDINPELLDKMLNNSEIPINANLSMTKIDQFKNLNFRRRFIRNRERKATDRIACRLPVGLEMCIKDTDEMREKVEKAIISQQELIKGTENEKFVLISDVAGSGKSWAMRSLALEMSSMKKESWVTFVDLKFHFKFFKNCKKKPCMEIFLMEEVLKELTDLEKEIFKQKYENGQVVIFFDGFDEIAPDCAEIVLNLMTSFEEIEGIQLFVSTRDFFEIDLKNEFSVEDTYKLVPLDDEMGIQLISRIWHLHDLKGSKTSDQSEALKNYEAMARKLIEKLTLRNYFNSLGMRCGPFRIISGINSPQIFSMIGKITKEKKELDESLNIFKLYDEMWNQTRKEWDTEKGEIRRNEGNESHSKELNFQNLHELIAIKRFAPGKLKYCDLNSRSIKHDWKGVSIDGCGLLTKKGKNYFFIHETFYEFFVAKFILRNLRYPRKAKEAFNFMQEILINDENKVIWRFLEEGLNSEKSKVGTSSSLNIFDDRKERRLKYFSQRIGFIIQDKIFDLLTAKLINHDTLADFLIEIFKKRDEKKFQEILRRKAKKWIKANERIGFAGFAIKLQKMFIALILSRIDIEIVVNVAEELNEMKSHQLSEAVGTNVFLNLAKSEISNNEQFSKFMEFIKKFLSFEKIAEKMGECNGDGETVYHFCVRHTRSEIGIFLEGFKDFFEANFQCECVHGFKEILLRRNNEGSTFLHVAAGLENLDFFNEHFWSSLLKAFRNDQDLLMDLFLQLDSKGRNCFHILKTNHNPHLRGESFKIALRQVRSAFSKDQCQRILKSKTVREKENLLCFHSNSEDIDTEKHLWKFLVDSVDTNEELLEILTDADIYGNNYLHRLLSAIFYENFPYVRLLEMEEMSSREEVKTLIRTNLNKFGHNFLQHATLFENLARSRKNSWKVLQRLFNPREIIDLVKHRDRFGRNFLQIYISNPENRLGSWTGNEIAEEMSAGGLASKESIERLAKIIKKEVLNEEDEEYLSLDWIDVGYEPVEPPETNLSDLNKLFSQVNCQDKNLIHRFLFNGNVHYLEPILRKIEAELDGQALETIVTLNYKFDYESHSENLFQNFFFKKTARVSLQKLLWRLMRDKFNFETILNILRHKEYYGNNLLMDVAKSGTEELARLIWEPIEENFKDYKNDIIRVIKERNKKNENILHLAAGGKNCTFAFFLSKFEQYVDSPDTLKSYILQKSNRNNHYPTILFRHEHCEDKNCHKTLWNLLLTGLQLDREELKNFLMHRNHREENFLDYLTERNESREVREFIMEKLKEIFIKGNDSSVASKILKNSRIKTVILYDECY